MADKHGAHQTGEAYVVSLCEDFCKSPTALVGYMISQKLDMSTLVCGSVNGCGTPVLNMSSRITHVTGNEAGVGGGAVSGVNVGMCKPVEDYAPKVRAEGQCLLRHDTIMEMNTAGASGVGNVLGTLVHSENMCSAYNDDQPGAMCEAGEWRNHKQIGEVEVDVNGQPKKIPVYEADFVGNGSGPNGQYQPRGDNSRIVINSNTSDNIRDLVLSHEKRHLSDDAFDGQLDGVLHDEHGVELSEDAAEERATRDGMKAAREKLAKMGYPFYGLGCYFKECTDVKVYQSAQGLKNRNHRAASKSDPKMCETPDAALEYFESMSGQKVGKH
jgi:hypothetical protein